MLIPCRRFWLVGRRRAGRGDYSSDLCGNLCDPLQQVERPAAALEVSGFSHRGNPDCLFAKQGSALPFDFSVAGFVVDPAWIGMGGYGDSADCGNRQLVQHSRLRAVCDTEFRSLTGSRDPDAVFCRLLHFHNLRSFRNPAYRKSAEDRLQEIAATYALVTDNSRDVILLADLDRWGAPVCFSSGGSNERLGNRKN